MQIDKRWGLVLLFWCAWSVISFSNTDPIPLRLESPEVLPEVISYLYDTDGTLAFGDIARDSQLFQSKSTEETVVDPGDHVYWIEFSVENADRFDRTWLLHFDKWLYVDAYVRFPGEDYEHRTTGHLVPYVERDYPIANENLIALSIPAGETVQCTVRLQTHHNYIVHPTDLSFRIVERTRFLRNEDHRSTKIAFFVGIYLIMFFYNFFLYLSTREKTYINYLIILLCVIFLTLHNFGYTVSLLKGIPGYVHWHSKMHFIIPGLMSVNVFLFIRGLLAIKARYPLLNHFVTFIIIISILLPVPSLLGYARLNDLISNLAGILALVTVLTIAIRSVIDKYPSAIFFLIGYGSFALGIIIQLLSFLAVLPENIINYNPLQIGSAIEVVMFSFALANKINTLKRDNELKQKEIISHLKQNEMLQSKVQRELEDKVAERTKQIEVQKDLIEKEKEKSDDLLLNILPPEVADELKRTGKATPTFYEMATVIFTDIKDFTKSSEQLPAEELVQDLDHCFGSFDEIALKHGIVKIKTMGDAYMCVAGVPVPVEDHAIRAINAALEFQEFMKEWNERRVLEGKAKWEIRCGVHSGPVTAGIVGKSKFAYDIWGGTVNIASRLESKGVVGKVNISQSTYDLVKHKFTCKSRGQVETRGTGPMNMYFIELERV